MAEEQSEGIAEIVVAVEVARKFVDEAVERSTSRMDSLIDAVPEVNLGKGELIRQSNLPSSIDGKDLSLVELQPA